MHLSAASRDPLNPLAPPGRRLEGIREVLCFVHDLAVAELHNAHCVRWSPLVRDCVFRDPEIPVSENPLDVEARGLAWMMTPQGLQIASSEVRRLSRRPPSEWPTTHLETVTRALGRRLIRLRVVISTLGLKRRRGGNSGPDEVNPFTQS